jgi:hypothetical protein
MTAPLSMTLRDRPLCITDLLGMAVARRAARRYWPGEPGAAVPGRTPPGAGAAGAASHIQARPVFA